MTNGEEPEAAEQYNDTNERDIEAKQRAPRTSGAFEDDDIDESKVKVLPGTGGPDDVGDIEASPDDYDRQGNANTDG